MSCIKLFNDLNNQYTKIHRVTYLLNKRDLECVDVLENWFAATETILKDNNFGESKWIAKYKGQLMIERLRTDPKMPKRKREFNAVSKVIEPLKKTVINLLEPVSDKINKSEILVDRMLTCEKFNWNIGLNYRDYILAVWRTLLRENSTKVDAKKVLNLIGEEDALKILANKLKPKN